MNSSHIAIINKSAPYGAINGQESLEMALALSNFGQSVSLFFIEDGVLQLLKHQSPELIQHKAYHKTFAALPFYDIDNIYVCQQSLNARSLSESGLSIEVTLVESKQLAEFIAAHNKVMVF